MSLITRTRLNFITGNKDKLSEVKVIMGDLVEIFSQSLDLVEIQGTIKAIAKDKCRRAAIAVRITREASCHQSGLILGFDKRSMAPS